MVAFYPTTFTAFDMHERKLGRRPSLPKDLRRRLVLKKYMDALPDVPDECDWTGGITDWQMLLNGGDGALGDCGPAAMFHGVMSKLACVATGSGLALPTPPADVEVVKFYSAAGGYVPGRPWTDGGVNNSDMLSVAQKQGLTLAGQHHVIGPYASVQADDFGTIKKAIYYLGGCLVGCNLPNSWYTNSGPGVVWDKTNSRIVGGHDIWAYAYNKDGFFIVTWGQGGTLVTWAGAEQNCDEIDGLSEQDAWIAANDRTPNGIQLVQWLEDVKVLTGG
jgi:hypothetical protein